MGKWDKIYRRLPVLLQHGAVTIYGLYWHWLRFGPGFNESVEGYIKRERMSQTSLERWQSERLRELLFQAAHHVPYYRETWSDAEKRAAEKGDLSRLPLLDKEPIRENPTRFLNESKRVVFKQIFHTSGSTGTPIATYWTTREYRDALALREVRSAKWAGVSFSMPRATFSGRIVEPDPESNGPFYRFNAVEQQVYFSAFHLRRETAKKYVEALHRHGIQWLTGYAVSYYLLARFILMEDLNVPPLKAVITTSEKVSPEMRRIMESAYGCRVYEEYSTVENALFVSECSRGKLHVSTDSAIVEILRPDGTPCHPGEAGEVVATCMSRLYQPLIRYRLGDTAIMDPNPCDCGLPFPVMKEVVGRVEDVVIGPDGREMVRFHGVFANLDEVVEGQVIQKSLHDITIKVVGTKFFGRDQEDEIIRRVKQRLGPQVRVKVRRVMSIPRTKAGKFQAVISLLHKGKSRGTEKTGVGEEIEI